MWENKMKTSKYRKELRWFFLDNRFMVAVFLTAILCYGYSVTHITIGVDTLLGDRYFGEGNGMLEAGRFGMTFLARLLGYGNAEPFYQPSILVLSVVMLLLAAIQFSVLFYHICGTDISKIGYGIFSCIFISYPLMNEIWQYPGANSAVCGGFLLVAGALYIMYRALHDAGLRQKKRVACVCTSSVLLMLVCAGYESLAVVYVFMTFTILSLQLVRGADLSFGEIIHRGLFYALPLVIGLLLRVIVHKAILLTFGLQMVQNGDTAIQWARGPALNTLWNVIRGCGFMYGLRAFVYFPITELVVAVIVFITLLIGTVIKKRNPNLLLTGGGMLLSLILLSLLQGKHTPYRACQVFAVMVAVTAMALYECLRHCCKKKIASHLVAVFLTLLCLHQATYLNRLLVLDNLRSEEEAFVIRTIGTDLLRNYDVSKPIVLVGEYELSPWITEQVTTQANMQPIYFWITQKLGGGDTEKIQRSDKYVVSNVNPILNSVANSESIWDTGTLGNRKGRLFYYYGFDFDFSVDTDLKKEVQQYAEKIGMPGYPQDGYIQEKDDYIIVNLSQAKVS